MLKRPAARAVPGRLGSRRAAAAVLAALVAARLLVLPLQAAADAWHAPALVPQRLGTRGLRLAITGQAGAALGNSLLIALATTALALPLGWPAARALAGRRVRHPTLVLLLLAMPLLVPAYATGTGLAEWFIRLGLAGTRLGLVLAHLTMVLPYVVLVLTAGFGERLVDLEEMGRTLGFSPPRRLLLVTVPAVRPTLATACLLGFLVSWSQYGLSLAVGGGLPTLPLALLPFVRTDPQAAATVALLFLAPAIAALAIATRAARRPP
jgi:putative spermidine/putrescine transport system permease protein